jgi:hypothetical protein
MPLKKMKPSVSKYWLIALAGLTWSTVGIILCRLAYIWLAVVPWSWSLPLGTISIISAIAAYRYGFSGIAIKNISRLCLLSDKSCLFSFQAWKSYLLIVFMIILGITLRHSPLPKHYLAIIYMTIGGALFLSSFHYYRLIWQVKIQKLPCQPSEKP